MKYYYYSYDYLIEKLKERYKVNTLVQLLYAANKELNITEYSLRRILIHHNSYFTVHEITHIKSILKLSDEEVIKCFFNVEESFKYKDDLYKKISETKRDIKNIKLD